MSRVLRNSFALAAFAALGIFFASCGGGTADHSISAPPGDHPNHPVVTLDATDTAVAGEAFAFTVSTDVPDADGGVTHFRAGTDPDNLPDVLSGAPSGFSGEWTFEEAGTYYIQGNYAPQTEGNPGEHGNGWTGGESGVIEVTVEEPCAPTSIVFDVEGTTIPVGLVSDTNNCPGTRGKATLNGSISIHNGSASSVTYTVASGHLRGGSGVTNTFTPNSQNNLSDGATNNFATWSVTLGPCSDGALKFTISKTGGFNGGMIADNFHLTSSDGIDQWYEQANVAP